MSIRPYCALAASLLIACGDPTELVVVVDTDLVIPTEIDHVVVTVVGPSGTMASASRDVTGCEELPLTVSVRPGGRSLGPVTVSVTGSGTSGTIFRDARTTLVRGRHTMLTMSLLRSCRGVPCPVNESCGETGCADRDRDPLPDWTGAAPARIGACGLDGGLDDASFLDADGDGVPRATDCDDTDPSVGPSASRACTNTCAAGVEACTMGVWDECDAPSCTCATIEENTTRNVNCGNCGMQAQRCRSGSWTNEGMCTGEGDCPAGMRDPSGGAACGACGTMQRTCSQTCSWGEWSCAQAMDACMPDAAETMTMGCGASCQQHTRTCASTCTWGTWSDWSACTGSPGCTPGTSEEDPNHPPCGMCGTETRTRSCDPTTCAWTDWSSPSCDGQHGVCTQGQREHISDVDCGRCGTAERFRVCNGNCAWVEMESGCGGEHGSCDEGDTTTGTRPCDSCTGRTIPTRSTCNASCEWDTFDTGTCTGAECTPGETRNCTTTSSCGGQPLYSFDYCTPGCSWQAAMNCGRCGI